MVLLQDPARLELAIEALQKKFTSGAFVEMKEYV